MSISWGAIKKDEKSILVSSIYWGIAIAFIIGIPILIISNYVEELSTWIGLLVIIILIPILSFSFYKSLSKNSSKK